MEASSVGVLDDWREEEHGEHDAYDGAPEADAFGWVVESGDANAHDGVAWALGEDPDGEDAPDHEQEERDRGDVPEFGGHAVEEECDSPADEPVCE